MKKIKEYFRKNVSIAHDVIPFALAIIIMPILFIIMFSIIIYPIHWIWGLEDPWSMIWQYAIIFSIISIVGNIIDRIKR